MPAHHENSTESTHTYIYIYIYICVCAKIQIFLMCKQAINLELQLVMYLKRRLHWYQKPAHFTHTVYSAVL